jgi:starch-binding outer membrane protein, SusD/RagB family
MNMKSIHFPKYIMAILIAIAPVYSCDDFLTVNPVSQEGPDRVFGDVENATRAVMGVYSMLGGDQAYGIRISMYYPYDNDEMMGQGPGTADNERRDIAHFNVQPSNTQLQQPFNQLYRGIERANICIYYIPKMDQYNSGSEAEQIELKRLYGEVLTLRAQFYFELVRNWGDVPAQFVPSSFATDLFLSKTAREEIYDKILADLAEASTLVPWRSQVASEERINQGGVRALRARIALAAGGYSLHNNEMTRASNYLDYYQIARDETKAIIDAGEHTLNPSFMSVFKDYVCQHKIEPNGEVIWEVGMSGGSSATGDSKMGYYNGPRANGKGNSALTVLPTTFYAFDANDTRRDVTVATYDLDASQNIVARQLNALVDGKYRRDWIPNAFASDAQYFGLNWVMIRYSDVLLMFAEAENELNNGPTADAITQFEKVRLRAFGGNASLIGTTPADYAGFFAAIKKERMLELCGEGVRKYDLIRWNILGQRLAEVKQEMANLVAGNAPYNNVPTVMYYQTGVPTMTWANSFYAPAPGSAPAGTTSIPWRTSAIQTGLIDVLGYAFTPGKSELLPFHTSTIEANPKLGANNYGY